MDEKERELPLQKRWVLIKTVLNSNIRDFPELREKVKKYLEKNP